MAEVFQTRGLAEDGEQSKVNENITETDIQKVCGPRDIGKKTEQNEIHRPKDIVFDAPKPKENLSLEKRVELKTFEKFENVGAYHSYPVTEADSYGAFHSYCPSQEDGHVSGELEPEDRTKEKPFILLEPLGSGGFGQVWKAQWYTGDIVTVKYCDDVDNETLAIDLDHPNITTILGQGVDKQGKYVIREYVEGRNLKAILGKDYALPAEDFFIIASQIIDATKYLHDKGIAHGDLKPENVLVPNDLLNESVKITDFGLAQAITKECEQSIETKMIRGTIDFMAPEQLYERKKPTKKSDIYSLGKLLLRMKTGELKYHPSTEALRNKFGQEQTGACSGSAYDLELCLLHPSERPEIEQIQNGLEAMAREPKESFYKVIEAHVLSLYSNKLEQEVKLQKNEPIQIIEQKDKIKSFVKEIAKRVFTLLMPGYTLYQGSRNSTIGEQTDKGLGYIGGITDALIFMPAAMMVISNNAQLNKDFLYLAAAGIIGKLMLTRYLDRNIANTGKAH